MHGRYSFSAFKQPHDLLKPILSLFEECALIYSGSDTVCSRAEGDEHSTSYWVRGEVLFPSFHLHSNGGGARCFVFKSLYIMSTLGGFIAANLQLLKRTRSRSTDQNKDRAVDKIFPVMYGVMYLLTICEVRQRLPR